MVKINVARLRNSTELIKFLEANGWECKRKSGSHMTFKKVGIENIITIPHPRKDLPEGTTRAILKSTGLL